MYRPKKLITNNIMPEIKIFFLPNLSAIIPENRLASKIPKALSDKAKPIFSKLTSKLSTKTGIKGPTIEPPNPNIKSWMKKSGNILFIIV